MKVQDVHPRLKAGLLQTIKLAEMTRDYYRQRIGELETLIASCQQNMADDRLPSTLREAEQHEAIANGGRPAIKAVDVLREAMSKSEEDEVQDAALVAVERALKA